MACGCWIRSWLSDEAGTVYRVSEEDLTVERLYASQSQGAACLYQNGILADFDSRLLLLGADGSVLGQLTLEKRNPAFCLPTAAWFTVYRTPTPE